MQKQGDRFYKIIEYGSYADSSKAVATFREVSYIQTKAALSRILGMEPKEGGYTTLTSWTKERRRPSSKYLRRLCRLRLWADEGLALWDIKRINWDDLELEWNNPVKTDDPLYDPVSDNPFYMSRWTTFPFGSRRDSVHLLRDLERVHRLDTLTKGPRAAVARLLGMDPAAGGWTKVARWHRPGPLYGAEIPPAPALAPSVGRPWLCPNRHPLRRLGQSARRVGFGAPARPPLQHLRHNADRPPPEGSASA